MASSAQGVSGSQFFVIATGGAAELGSGNYPLFGAVTSGQSVVDKINAEGSAAGIPPDVTERILSITIHEATSAVGSP
jgi:cyclophilin family peptidyl-prolyl cis-trans isomerase